MTGCLSPTAGKIMIDGHDILTEPEAAKRCMGYLAEQLPLYLNETPWEYLTFVGEAKGLRGGALHSQIEVCIELCVHRFGVHCAGADHADAGGGAKAKD